MACRIRKRIVNRIFLKLFSVFTEARQHGVGFYSFSKDEEERAKQMEELERIRKQTEMARAQTAQTSLDKQSALEARLKKVRDRKRQKLGLPPLSKKREILMGSKLL